MATDLGDDFRAYKERKHKSNEGFQKYCKDLLIDWCAERGLYFKEIKSYQFRISGNYNGFVRVIDVFPNTCKYHNITHNRRGTFNPGLIEIFMQNQFKK